MKTKFRKATIILITFAVWTIVVLTTDVKPIGPFQSSVGLSKINGFFHRLTGLHMWLYQLTDWLSIIPLGIVLGFAMIGLIQWIQRKKLMLVDHDILVLGCFYAVVMAVYILFEICVVNYRPVLIDGILEASYPSSTTMLVMCVIPTAMLQIKTRVRNRRVGRFLTLIMGSFLIFMVIARLLSGVHWLTDIIGGALLSTGLVVLYDAVCTFVKNSAL